MARAKSGFGSPGNPILRLVFVHSLFGASAGLAFALALVVLNAHGLGRLLLGSDAGLVGFVLLASGFMVTFASVAAGTAIMQIGPDSTERSGPRGPSALPPSERLALVRIPLRAASGRPRHHRHGGGG